jgi:hypothetical protein
LQHIKLLRPGKRPIRPSSRRIGADAAFAKAMARSEFGRFYTDEHEQREVRRSLERAKSRRLAPQTTQSKEGVDEPVGPKSKTSPRVAVWTPPSPRHRRSEIADAMARLKLAGRLRKERDNP